MTTHHVGTDIARPAAAVYDYIRDYRNLPEWAAGLSAGVRQEDGHWVCASPMGRVTVAFVADNPFGVCDHAVTLPDGTVTTNPLRVIADGPRCQVVFAVRGDDVAADARLVQADLDRLKANLEGTRTPARQPDPLEASSEYEFFVHRTAASWRLVLAAGAPPPSGFTSADWRHTRTRTAADTNPDVRRQCEERGFCLFSLGGTFADVGRT